VLLLLPLGVLVPATAEAPAAPAHESAAFSNAKTDSDDTSVASTRPQVQQWWVADPKDAYVLDKPSLWASCSHICHFWRAL
jgi:hypothetical protein